MAKGTVANRNETFGRLLSGMVNSIASYEGKSTATVEDELGAAIHVVGKTIQRYKAGYLPPTDEAVRLLAEAAVRRGFLGREWLQRFLHAARYPFADKLLNELCPALQVRPRPPRVYENLPAPTYSQFVMREQAFTEMLDGLQQRSAAVLVIGLGGNGKTSLAREVAAYCLRDNADAPRFDAVVWVSDKDRPGTTNLSVVLDELARTLDYPGFTQFAHDEKQREVEQLLRRQRVLLVVDNFETITDGVLLTWLLRLPEPSKALITSREKHRALWGSWLVELRGMSESEAWALITERARVLKIDRLVGERTQLEPLLAATGGNPKALTMTLGLLKYEYRSLQDIVDDLYAARGDLFDDLFVRAWALLDEAARRILLVATFFPTSASGDALRSTADVQGFAFDRAVERLADMALLDVQQTDLNRSPRYLLHPLVRAFAGVRLTEQPGFEDGARERWATWYLNQSAKVGHCWDDLKKLTLLDGEEKNLFAVARWLFEKRYYSKVISLVKNIGYFYHVRGYWPMLIELNTLRVESARQLQDILAEIHALSDRVQMQIMSMKIDEIETEFIQLNTIADGVDLAQEVWVDYHHAVASYKMANGDLLGAFEEFQKIVAYPDKLTPREFANNLQRLGQCLYHLGQVEQALQMLYNSLIIARKHNYTRGIIVAQYKIASIEIDHDDLLSANERLSESIDLAVKYDDARYIPEIHLEYSRIYRLKGNILAACDALKRARDLFERMGMRRELAEARQALADLDTGVASSSDAAPA